MPETPLDGGDPELVPEFGPDGPWGSERLVPDEEREPTTGPVDVRPAKERAREWYLAELDAGRDPNPTEVNRQVGTNSYVKKAWLDEWRAERGGVRQNGHRVGIQPAC